MAGVEVDQFVGRPAELAWQALTDPDLLARWQGHLVRRLLSVLGGDARGS
jgi:uncharacterized protein YndB with AHSA1/START domain